MKIKERENNESEKNENKINIKKDAINNNDNEITRNNYHFENFYQN